MRKFISDSASIKNSTYGDGMQIYRNAWLHDCVCGKNISIGDDSIVERCTLGDYVTINRRCYVNDSTIGDFSLVGLNSIVRPSVIGKFCEIAQYVDIGGANHDYKKVTTYSKVRFQQALSGERPKYHLNIETYTSIGNDVWIASGARVFRKVKIGDGACIGAGAVVTKDVPPYAIVAGVPAKIIKYRFPDKFIEELLKIKWWDWSTDILMKNMDLILSSDVNEDTISKMKEIALQLQVGDLNK